MADRLSPESRGQNMARIKGKDTIPELVVRRLLHRLGYRYRIHYNRLPGRPDIVFPARRKAILVHGCFWHRHPGCQFAYTPKSRVPFWETKFEQNKTRDAKNWGALEDLGWTALVVWECETRDPASLRAKLVNFLEAPNASQVEETE